MHSGRSVLGPRLLGAGTYGPPVGRHGLGCLAPDAGCRAELQRPDVGNRRSRASCGGGRWLLRWAERGRRQTRVASATALVQVLHRRLRVGVAHPRLDRRMVAWSMAIEPRCGAGRGSPACAARRSRAPSLRAAQCGAVEVLAALAGEDEVGAVMREKLREPDARRRRTAASSSSRSADSAAIAGIESPLRVETPRAVGTAARKRRSRRSRARSASSCR